MNTNTSDQETEKINEKIAAAQILGDPAATGTVDFYYEDTSLELTDAVVNGIPVKVLDVKEGAGGTGGTGGGGGTATVTGVEFFLPENYGVTGVPTDDTAAGMNAMFADMPARGGKVLFGNRDYLAQSTIVANKPCVIEGQGRGNTFFMYHPENANNATTRILSTVNNIHVLELAAPGIKITDLAIVNKVTGAPSSGSGIHVTTANTAAGGGDYAAGFIIRDVSVGGFYDNVNIENAYQWLIDNIYCYGSKRYGIWVRNSLLPDGGDSSLINSFLYGSIYNSDAGIRYETSGGLKIANTKFNCGSDMNLRFTNGIDIAWQSGSVIFEMCNSSIENTHGSPLKIRTNGQSFKGIMISNVEFAPNKAGVNHIDIDGTTGTLNGIAISNNTFLPIYTSERAMSIKNCKYVTIGANTIDLPNDLAIQPDEFSGITGLTRVTTTTVNV